MKMKFISKLIKVANELKEFEDKDVGKNVSLHFNYKHIKKWKKFLKKYNPELEYNGHSTLSSKLTPVADVVIDDVMVTVFGPYEDNPEFDADAAREDDLRREIPKVLACAVRSGAIEVDVTTVIDDNKCVQEFDKEDIKFALWEFIRKRKNEGYKR